MKFIELTTTQYNRETKKEEPFAKFMIDMASQWEIHDRGDSPACWVNNNMGMNKNVNETYAQLKQKFLAAGMLLDLDNIVPEVPLKKVIKRSDLHSLLMNKTNHTYSQAVHILDVIMPKIQGE